MKKIICGFCGKIEKAEGEIRCHEYFPNRYVYVNKLVHICKCGRSSHSAIFGEVYFPTFYYSMWLGYIPKSILNNNRLYEKSCIKETT